MNPCTKKSHKPNIKQRGIGGLGKKKLYFIGQQDIHGPVRLLDQNPD
jgi:hypothetical protein